MQNTVQSVGSILECDYCHEQGHIIGDCAQYHNDILKEKDMLAYIIEHGHAWWGEL